MPPEAPAKVVIVDDEPDVLESTALVVEALGYEAVRVADHAKVVEVVEREQPGVLLQDLKMPGLNVSGLVAALRLNPRTAHVPIVFVSAGGDLATTAASLDAWGYLSKPFGKQALSAVLEQTMGPPPPEPPAAPSLGPGFQRELRGVLRESWGVLASLNNALIRLTSAAPRAPEVQRPVAAMGDVLLKLESKTDELAILARSLVGPASAEPEGPVARLKG
jgi:CheY-like chemotaxis protein